MQAGAGCVLEVVENRRFVWTEAMGPGFRPVASDLPFTAIITMEPAGSGTRYRAVAVHGSTETRTEHEKMGFHEGWGAALDQLVEVRPGPVRLVQSRTSATLPEVVAPADQGGPMGKIVSNFFMSLDGVVESPDKWHFPYLNDEMGDAVGKGLETTKAMLMGRVLYEEWAGYWPTSEDEPIASHHERHAQVRRLHARSPRRTGTTPRSSTATWRPAIRDLKDSTEGDISMSGSATLVRWLLANGLLDRLNLLVHPIAVGKGQRLFEDTPTQPLQLVSQETFSTGVLNLSYAPADA